MEFNHDIFKDRLKKITNGIAQKKIASEIGVTPSTLSKWLNGNSIPDTEILLTISEIYGCSVDYLLGNDLNNNKGNHNEENLSASDICRFLYHAHKKMGFHIDAQKNESSHKDEITGTPYLTDLKIVITSQYNFEADNPVEAKKQSLCKAVYDFLDKYNKIVSLSNDLGDSMKEEIIDMLINKSDKAYDNNYQVVYIPFP